MATLVSCTSLIAAHLHGFRSLFIFYIITFCFSNYIVYNIRVRLLLYHLKDKCELYTYHKELIGILKAKEKLFHMLKNQVLFLYFTALKNVCHFYLIRKVKHSWAQPCAHLIVHDIHRPTNTDAPKDAEARKSEGLESILPLATEQRTGPEATGSQKG